MKRFVAPIAVIALLGGIVVTTLTAYAKGAVPTVGKKVPPFSMTDTKGKKHTDKTLLGKVVLLDFWATWCGPCKAASPTMQKLHAKYAKQGFVMIGANTGEQEKGPKNAIDYAKEHKYTYTFTYNNDKLTESWGVQGIPYFVLIDRKGNVLRVDTGFDPSMESALEKSVVAALKAR